MKNDFTQVASLILVPLIVHCLVSGGVDGKKSKGGGDNNGDGSGNGGGKSGGGGGTGGMDVMIIGANGQIMNG